LMDHWRRVKRERRWKADHLFDESESTGELNAEGMGMRLFRGLKPREQALLWLAYVEGFDHREIALALQLSEKSVRVLLYRARHNLERILRQNGLSEVQP